MKSSSNLLHFTSADCCLEREKALWQQTTVSLAVINNALSFRMNTQRKKGKQLSWKRLTRGKWLERIYKSSCKAQTRKSDGWDLCFMCAEFPESTSTSVPCICHFLRHIVQSEQMERSPCGETNITFRNCIRLFSFFFYQMCSRQTHKVICAA